MFSRGQSRHALAPLAFGFTLGVTCLDSPPNYVLSFLSDDFRGVCFSRMVGGVTLGFSFYRALARFSLKKRNLLEQKKNREIIKIEREVRCSRKHKI